MFQSPRAVVLSLLCVALFATSAAAECAWVLWSRYNLVNLTLGRPTQQGRWQIESAAPTHAACNDAARARAVRMAEPPPASGNARTRVMDELIGGGFSRPNGVQGFSRRVGFSRVPVLPREISTGRDQGERGLSLLGALADTVDPRSKAAR